MGKRECTGGECPCEMSTHLSSLESENLRLKSILADIRNKDIENYTVTGKFFFDDELRRRISLAI